MIVFPNGVYDNVLKIKPPMEFQRHHVDLYCEALDTVERLGTRPSYTYQLEAFGEHVLNGAPLPFGTADAVENMAYVDAAYRAAGMSPR